MDVFLATLLSSLVLLAVVLELQKHSRGGSAAAAGQQHQPTEHHHGRGGGGGGMQAFRSFRNNYLLVYSLMMAGDWLQGPYIYALYENYGFKVGDIGRLFIAGFGSSMIFGTVAGALADKYGRKRACLLYVLSYSLSCLTKHSGSYHVLLLGRLLGGVSTSLLFSSFESWLVAEHQLRGFDPALLGDVFSQSVFLGGGLMAILSGLLGDVLVEGLGLGAVAPFDSAILILLLGGSIVAATWPENYGGGGGGGHGERGRGGHGSPPLVPAAPGDGGDAEWRLESEGGVSEGGTGGGRKGSFGATRKRSNSGGESSGGAGGREREGAGGSRSLYMQFKAAAHAIAADRKVALLGAMQSLFEASMYTFVFLWTPALSPNGEKVSHGLVFACFMTACMAGSALTGLLLSRQSNGSSSGGGNGMGEETTTTRRRRRSSRVAGPEGYMIPVFLVSSLAMTVPFAFHLEIRDADTGSSLGTSDEEGSRELLSTEGKLQLLAFCLFEGCVGIFWPSMMAMRARFVPEELRSTIMNLFRIPLNGFVCLILYEVSRLPLSVVFGLCAVMLLVCALCQRELNRLIDMEEKGGGGEGQRHQQQQRTMQTLPLFDHPEEEGLGEVEIARRRLLHPTAEFDDVVLPVSTTAAGNGGGGMTVAMSSGAGTTTTVGHGSGVGGRGVMPTSSADPGHPPPPTEVAAHFIGSGTSSRTRAPSLLAIPPPPSSPLPLPGLRLRSARESTR